MQTISSVRNENFYAIAAQVLPTLLIAIVIELRLLLTIEFRQYIQARDKLQRSSAESGLFIVRWAWTAVAASFVAGELSALLVVFAGTDGWLPRLAAPLVGLSLLVLGLAAVFLPYAVAEYQAER